MPISVRDVLQMEGLERARVVAGEGGLDREVRWITVGEEPDLPDWVFGGELILSTLFAVETGKHADYVKRLADGGVSGMMIKSERFLGALPKGILEVANHENLPVAEVPTNVLWSRVVESFYRHLLVEQTERIRVETEMQLRGGFFDELLSNGLSEEEILRRAELLGCNLSGGGAVIFFEAPNFEEFARKRKLGELQLQHLKTLLYEAISGAVREVHSNYICIPRADNVLLLLGSPLEDRRGLARHVLARCRERLKNLPVHAGLGEFRGSPGRLVESYREAEAALIAGRSFRESGGLEGRVHSFADTGIRRLLFVLSQDNPEVLRSFVDNALGPAIHYDGQHGTELVKTLKTYTDCNGNVSEAAELLHVHKHTVRYRLRRLTELTGYDVTKFEDAAQLYLAVKATGLRS